MSDSDESNIEEVSDTSSNRNFDQFSDSELKGNEGISNDKEEDVISNTSGKITITPKPSTVQVTNDVSASNDSSGDTNIEENKKIKDLEDKSLLEKDKESRSSDKLNYKQFIKEKFLVDMPEDFYQFWNYCKKIKTHDPLNALKEIGLKLVGPFDVLAGKFDNIDKSDEEYLLHWRYYHDPPELQTVLKGDDKTGFHMGYFRDCPDELPIFLVSNCAKKDGVLYQMGPNIFAAVK